MRVRSLELTADEMRELGQRVIDLLTKGRFSMSSSSIVKPKAGASPPPAWRGVRLYFHRFGNRAQLQVRVDARVAIHVQDDPGLLEFLEAIGIHFDAVGSQRQERQRITTVRSARILAAT